MTQDPIERALADLGLTLPTPLVPNATYVASTEFGGLLHVAGQLAYDAEGSLPFRGRLGVEVDLETGKQCARRCALHLLAQIKGGLGSLSRVHRILKLQVYVACAPDFTDQHLVANGASDLLCSVLGAAGAHARSAFGVASLPFGSPVEVDAVVAFAAGRDQKDG
ncbi:MAG: RidA family protein [Conexibacter sp.]